MNNGSKNTYCSLTKFRYFGDSRLNPIALTDAIPNIGLMWL